MMNSMEGPLRLVGSSSGIQVVQQLIHQVAKTPASVLILGESGTGKEMVARIIHAHSERAQAPFIPINCAAIPLDLLESELFGHEKGSFTGAYLSRQGRFELANGGTLFLDEIGDMPLSMQAKLLRVLQEKTFERVGGNKSIKADVRVIAATHQDLENAMREGCFREDLFYRLNVFPIQVPPLRDRIEDLGLLIEHFIQKTKQENKTDSFEFEKEALEALRAYDWPGNVRELSNLIERFMILHAGKKVELNNLPETFFRGTERRNNNHLTIFTAKNNQTMHSIHGFLDIKQPFDLKDHLAKLEFNFITEALNDCHGIVAQAAKKLGLRRTTLVEKMKKFGLGREINYKTQ